MCMQAPIRGTNPIGSQNVGVAQAQVVVWNQMGHRCRCARGLVCYRILNYVEREEMQI
jgi:hypothetical protein